MGKYVNGGGMSCVAMRGDWWYEVEGLDQTKEIVQHMTEGLMADCSSSSVTTATDHAL